MLTGSACVRLKVARRYLLLDSKLVRHLVQRDLRGLETLGPLRNDLATLGRHNNGPRVSKSRRSLGLGI